jgi:hypothetical protein
MATYDSYKDHKRKLILTRSTKLINCEHLRSKNRKRAVILLFTSVNNQYNARETGKAMRSMQVSNDINLFKSSLILNKDEMAKHSSESLN